MSLFATNVQPWLMLEKEKNCWYQYYVIHLNQRRRKTEILFLCLSAYFFFFFLWQYDDDTTREFKQVTWRRTWLRRRKISAEFSFLICSSMFFYQYYLKNELTIDSEMHFLLSIALMNANVVHRIETTRFSCVFVNHI